MFSTVVLPAPFGPIRLVTSPERAVKETPVAAFTPPKAMVRLDICRDFFSLLF